MSDKQNKQPTMQELLKSANQIDARLRGEKPPVKQTAKKPAKAKKDGSESEKE